MDSEPGSPFGLEVRKQYRLLLSFLKMFRQKEICIKKILKLGKILKNPEKSEACNEVHVCDCK